MFVYVRNCSYTNMHLFVYKQSWILTTTHIIKITKIYVFVYEQHCVRIRAFTCSYTNNYGVRIQTFITFVYVYMCTYTNNICLYTNNRKFLHRQNFLKVVRFEKIIGVRIRTKIVCMRAFALVYKQQCVRIRTFIMFVYVQNCSYTNMYLFVYEQQLLTNNDKNY